MDSAESLGDAGNRLNLIRAAASLPEERSKGLLNSVLTFCKALVMENRVETDVFTEILASKELRPVEGRVLLGAAMFIIDKEVPTKEAGPMPLIDVLGELVQLVRREQLLTRNDPFLVEAQCALEALEMEAEEAGE